mmetsp:Transcript_25610/g.67109  ORF Transcript_25610/g.67109 Transcript_25610/m.67109 type:complete len:107 (+) Transcript_25610:672-992(+)
MATARATMVRSGVALMSDATRGTNRGATQDSRATTGSMRGGAKTLDKARSGEALSIGTTRGVVPDSRTTTGRFGGAACRTPIAAARVAVRNAEENMANLLLTPVFH